MRIPPHSRLVSNAQKSDKRPLLIANFKQNLGVEEVCAWLKRIANAHKEAPLAREVELVVAPPATALWAARPFAARAQIALAAQEIFYEEKGAFTGALGGPQVRDAGASWTFIGHSERHLYFQENWDNSAKRIKAAQKAGLAPLICVGESAVVRQRHQTQAYLTDTLNHLILPLPREARANLSFAYEPLWAIGTGSTATPKDAQNGCALIRTWLAEHAEDALSTCRIVYGGSVHAGNAASLLGKPDVDGLLIGGASLDADSFWSIIQEGTQQ